MSGRVLWIATPLKWMDEEAAAKLPKSGNVDAAYFDSIGLDPGYYRPILEFAQVKGHPYTDIRWNAVGGGGVARARNRIASEFYASTKNDDDTLLWYDYDLRPTVADFVSVLQRDLDICGGLYTIRCEHGHWVLNKFPGAIAKPSRSGLFPVMELGTGFKAMKRRVFRRALESSPWLDCESDFDHTKRELGFFSMGPVHDPRFWPGKHRWLTEDYWFDWICREAGIVCVVDQNVRIRHWDENRKQLFPTTFPPLPGELPAEAVEP